MVTTIHRNWIKTTVFIFVMQYSSTSSIAIKWSHIITMANIMLPMLIILLKHIKVGSSLSYRKGNLMRNTNIQQGILIYDMTVWLWSSAQVGHDTDAFKSWFLCVHDAFVQQHELWCIKDYKILPKFNYVGSASW